MVSLIYGNLFRDVINYWMFYYYQDYIIIRTPSTNFSNSLNRTAYRTSELASSLDHRYTITSDILLFYLFILFLSQSSLWYHQVSCSRSPVQGHLFLSGLPLIILLVFSKLRYPRYLVFYDGMLWLDDTFWHNVFVLVIMMMTMMGSNTLYLYLKVFIYFLRYLYLYLIFAKRKAFTFKNFFKIIWFLKTFSNTFKILLKLFQLFIWNICYHHDLSQEAVW